MRIFILLCLVVAGHCSSIFDNIGDESNNYEINLFQSLDELDAKYPEELDAQFGSKGLCVIGCTPYVDFTNNDSGIRKYRRLVEEMAQECDVLVHVGDTKPGIMPCDRSVLTKSIHIMKRAARLAGKLALYAPGDNELNDCHRLGSREGEPIPSDFYKAAEARQFLIDDLRLDLPRDLTRNFRVDNHDMSHRVVPGSSEPYSCDFDKYVELNNYAVATLEVIGSHYYLDDERENKPPNRFPKQDEVDPLAGRLSLFLNANDCTLDWIEQSTAKAKASGKRALFFLLHAKFYSDNGKTFLGNNGIGEYYSTENLAKITKELTGTAISRPYEPLFQMLNQTALDNPELMFYVVHADGHRFTTVRMNPTVDNRGDIDSHHNIMLHQVEGASRSLTMYAKFTVDENSFQPITLKEEWSRAAYNEYPYGHSWDPY